MSAQPAKEYASPDECATALEGLGVAGRLRLEQLARNWAFGLDSGDWEDVLQTAVRRVLEGTRRWPRDVPLMAFLAGVMRSIADELRDQHRRDLAVREADRPESGDGSGGAFLSSLAAEDPDPEAAAVAAERFAAVDALLADDEDAWIVATARAEGAEPAEIQREHGLTPTEYATVLRRIRRKWLRLLAEEVVP